MLEKLIGRPPGDTTAERLRAYADWLGSEGIRAGGLGPGEDQRVWQRHILDSAAFTLPWSVPPDRCTDLGSGVGLPGIVLAVLWPETAITMIDRSGRRTGLIRRAARVLGLGNVEVVQGDIAKTPTDQSALVMRAVLPPPEAIRLFGRILGSGGQAVLGLSRTNEPDRQNLEALSAGSGLVGAVQKVKVLDPPAWMLIMSRS